nr:extensin-like [Setaria viridis]
MAFPREQTPHPRRRPTIPLPASCVPINAVPFLPRSSPPPSATPTPPPTPLNLPPFTTAFDPLRMLASTSRAPAVAERVAEPRPPASEEGPFYLGDLFREPLDKGKRVASGDPSSPQLRASRAIPQARDIRVVGAASPRRASGANTPAPGRSPPPTPPAGHTAPMALVSPRRGASSTSASMSAGEADSPLEEESVDSDAFDDGPDYLEVWVNEAAAAAPSPLIHAALHVAAPHLRFQLLPSPRGVALLHFGSPAAREMAMDVQPVHLNGATVTLERAEETDDRFVREPEWLAHVAIWNLPPEHWSVEQHPRLPSRLGVHTPSSRGVVLRLGSLAFWPREQQLDEAGDWNPFFGPTPPPPPPPHNNGLPPTLPPTNPAPPPPPAAHPPEQQHPAPLHPASFTGASILCHGFINPFPLPPLPTFPILIQLPPSDASGDLGGYGARPVLLLTWRPAVPEPCPPSTPPNTPLPARSPPTPPPATSDAPPHCPSRPPPRKRHSARLAAKEDGKFVDATSKAAQLKALRDSLALCSSAVQAHVAKKKLLMKRKKPISGADLVKLADAVGLGQETAKALDRVLAIRKATAAQLNQVLDAPNA